MKIKDGKDTKKCYNLYKTYRDWETHTTQNLCDLQKQNVWKISVLV